MCIRDSDTTDQLAVNTIRTLSLDAIQKANSGHPGLPMGLSLIHIYFELSVKILLSVFHFCQLEKRKN